MKNIVILLMIIFFCSCQKKDITDEQQEEVPESEISMVSINFSPKKLITDIHRIMPFSSLRLTVSMVSARYL